MKIETSHPDKIQTLDLEYVEYLNTVYISLFILKKEFRGMGYGKIIMREIIYHARKLQLCVCLVPDDSYGTPMHILEKFYERCGGLYSADGRYYFS